MMKFPLALTLLLSACAPHIPAPVHEAGGGSASAALLPAMQTTPRPVEVTPRPQPPAAMEKEKADE
jgi:hypothetical protein